MLDAAEIRRHKNSLRFTWHEKVLADAEVRKRPNALALAGYIMHRFNPDSNYAEFSMNDVVARLRMPRCTVLRSRDYLMRRGWIQIYERPRGPAGSYMALRYSLASGPDDHLQEEHRPGLTDDT